jgi:hypothetical protein
MPPKPPTSVSCPDQPFTPFVIPHMLGFRGDAVFAMSNALETTIKQGGRGEKEGREGGERARVMTKVPLS